MSRAPKYSIFSDSLAMVQHFRPEATGFSLVTPIRQSSTQRSDSKSGTCPVVKFTITPVTDFTVQFLKRMAHPRYKADMKIYVIPVLVSEQLDFYTSAAMFLQDQKYRSDISMPFDTKSKIFPTKLIWTCPMLFTVRLRKKKKKLATRPWRTWIVLKKILLKTLWTRWIFPLTLLKRLKVTKLLRKLNVKTLLSNKSFEELLVPESCPPHHLLCLWSNRPVAKLISPFCPNQDQGTDSHHHQPRLPYGSILNVLSLRELPLEVSKKDS